MIENEFKILVCLPTYHSKIEWIDRAINSLKSQIYEKFECFIVKDGCKKACDLNTCKECEICKETIDLCKKATKDSRFKFFNLPIHCGAAGWGPRNFAILNSSHPYISYLDDDNWYEPEHLELLHNLILQNVDLAYTGTRLYNSNYDIIGERIHSEEPKPGYIDTSEIMHKRYLIDKYGGWRFVSKCNDWDIISRWLPNITWKHTNQITLNFYVREGCGIHRE